MRFLLIGFRAQVRLCVLAGAIVFGNVGSSFADTTLSTSTNPLVEPEIDLGSRLAILLGDERSALGNVSTERMQVLTAPPASARKGANATPAISYDRAWLASQPLATGGDDWNCLAEALYFEARGESVRGQFAVTEVILNRVASRKFPNSVCRVVNQGTGRRHQCQFSYTCDGLAEVIGDPAAYRNVGKIARAALDGAPRRLTTGATYYHTKAVSPRWSRVFIRTTSIGVHHFYR